MTSSWNSFEVSNEFVAVLEQQNSKLVCEERYEFAL